MLEMQAVSRGVQASLLCGCLQVVALIRGAEDSAAASAALQHATGLSKHQAEAVLNLSLRRLTSLEVQKLQAEDDSLTLR